MKIWMHRYLHGSAYSYLTINEILLKEVNTDLAYSYVIANNPSEVPQIESVEMLEKLLKEYQYDLESTNDYDIVNKFFVEEDSTLSTNACYESLHGTVYNIITNYLMDEPFELDDYDTTDYDFEVE